MLQGPLNSKPHAQTDRATLSENIQYVTELGRCFSTAYI